MNLSEFSLNDWITIIIIVAQAGIVYYRLKKVEQITEQFNDLLIEFAVHKNSLHHYREQYDKQSMRIENIVQKLHDRISNIEVKAIEALRR